MLFHMVHVFNLACKVGILLSLNGMYGIISLSVGSVRALKELHGLCNSTLILHLLGKFGLALEQGKILYIGWYVPLNLKFFLFLFWAFASHANLVMFDLLEIYGWGTNLLSLK